VNFGDGAVQGNSANYQPDTNAQRQSPSAVVPQNWMDAEWQNVERQGISIPAPPAAPERPLALPSPQRATMQPQAPDSISGGVQAQHPGYTPDPAKTLANYAAWRTEPKPDQPPNQKPKRGRRKRRSL
jgi:hypothetical protein